MKRIESLVSNIVFAVQILLIFMLIFERFISLPIWLGPFGRLHPLVLHLPIGLLILVGALQFFKKEFPPEAFDKIQRFILYFSALGASFAALMGFFLAQEDGYSGDLLNWHKWTGVGVSFLSYGLILLQNQKNRQPIVFNVSLAASIILLVVAGHFGSGLTHGEDFVWAPLKSDDKGISEESTVFEAAVLPVLEKKCNSCHNERKHKGDLIMTNITGLTKGGENGPIWVAGDAENSALIQRVHLPLEEEEHMPPEGKPQLTRNEIKLLTAWINEGIDFEKTIGQLEPEEPLFQFASQRNASSGPKYTFKPASQKTIDKLNNPFRTVVPESFNSPALNAHIFVRANYEEASLTDLLAIKNQLVELNLTNMPIEDKDLKTIAQFKELRKLRLNGTNITGATLGDLKPLKKLNHLALSGTEVDVSISTALSQFPELEEVYVWNTKIEADDIETLSEALPDVNFYIGFIPDDDELLKLSAPILVNEKNVLSESEKVEFKHLFPNVQIRYTTDGSEPDSLRSELYESPFSINSFTEIKARAFTEGWLGSDIATFTFFKQGLIPEEVALVNQPNDQYQGSGANGLIDGAKGDAGNFRTPNWLGYRDKAFSALFDFGAEAPKVDYFTLSYCVNMGSYIMPPVWVEVWAGDVPNRMKRLKRVNLPKARDYASNHVAGLNIDIPGSEFQYYKIVAEPWRKLPAWHQGRGDKGWVFVDEIFAF